MLYPQLLTFLGAAFEPNLSNNTWQMTAATFVGLMSIPGLVVLYGGVMQKRWSVNSMMLAFVGFAVVIVIWLLYAYKMGFGEAIPLGGKSGFFHNLLGKPGSSLKAIELEGQGHVPNLGDAGKLDITQSSLIYFQLVFAAITPLLMLGSLLGRVNFKAWIPFVVLWITCVYCVNAFLIWGGGWFAMKGVLDFSGGYVIHLAAGVSGFVAAWVIGPRLARDREIDAPNNLAMVALGAGFLWLGWNGFNGGDPYNAGNDAAAAIVNTNLCTAVTLLVWVAWDFITGRKPSLIGSVNGMIVGLVAITPAAGIVNGWGAIIIGVVAATVVYLAYNYLALLKPFNKVDDTLGVVYTHGFAGLIGGLLVGLLADSAMYPADASAHRFLWQVLAGLWVIVFSAIMTFILLKIVGIFIPLRMSEEDMETGDLAVHGHEVYPSDIPSLGFPSGTPQPAPATTGGSAPASSS